MARPRKSPGVCDIPLMIAWHGQGVGLRGWGGWYGRRIVSLGPFLELLMSIDNAAD